MHRRTSLIEQHDAAIAEHVGRIADLEDELGRFAPATASTEGRTFDGMSGSETMKSVLELQELRDKLHASEAEAAAALAAADLLKVQLAAASPKHKRAAINRQGSGSAGAGAGGSKSGIPTTAASKRASRAGGGGGSSSNYGAKNLSTEALKRQIADLKAESGRLTVKCKLSEAKAVQATNATSALKKAAAAAEARASEAELHLAQAAVQIDALRNELGKYAEKNQFAEAVAEHMKQQLERERAKAAGEDAAAAAAMRRLAAAEREAASMRGAVQVLENELAAARSAKGAAPPPNAATATVAGSAVAAHLQAQMDALHRQLAAACGTNAELKRELEAANSRLAKCTCSRGSSSSSNNNGGTRPLQTPARGTKSIKSSPNKSIRSTRTMAKQPMPLPEGTEMNCCDCAGAAAGAAGAAPAAPAPTAVAAPSTLSRLKSSSKSSVITTEPKLSTTTVV